MTTSMRLRDSHSHVDSDEEEEEDLEAWHVAAEQRAAYLSRLPRLSSLELGSCPNEGALGALMSRYGAATQGRLTQLKLFGTRILSAASTCAIRAACPRLAQLQLSFVWRHHSANGALSGDVFLPLRDLPLTFLIMSGEPALPKDALRSLGGLSHLRHLKVNIAGVLPHHLRGLGALAALEQCTLGRADSALSLLDVQALFTLSRLTHLELPGLQHSGVRLHTLLLSATFVVDDAVFSSLRHLSQLETLRVGRIQLTHPQPGHLPSLKSLFVADVLRPSHLLQTLLPLLPLPSLTLLCHMGGVNFNCPRLDASCGGDGVADAEAQAAALKRAMAGLAAAPGMRGVTSVWVSCQSAAGVALSCVEVLEGLMPLAGQLHLLSLRNMHDVGVECAVLGASLSTVRQLVLVGCGVTDAALGALGVHWPALERLSVSGCTGLSAEGWLGLAAVRASALEVVVTVRPPAGGGGAW